MFNLKSFVYPVSILSGTIIGVGLFSLPYITSKVGIWAMLGYFLVLGILVALTHLFFGELALKTPDYKRLPGFAKIYLGSWGEKIALISTILGLFGALLAYLIVGGEFLENLLKPVMNGGNNLFYTLLYFAAGAALIFFGIKTIGKVEFWGLVLFFVVLFAVFFREMSFINIENLFVGNWKLEIGNFFLPYGPILFSLWGATLIPEAEEMLGQRKDLFKKIIITATLIPAVVYLFFIVLVLGITGSQTTESALAGLKNFLGNGVISLLFFFGILTTFTSFIALGLTLKNVFHYDLKIKKELSWSLACFPPLILFLIGFKSFISVISFVGGIMLGIDGILILLMYRKLVQSSRPTSPASELSGGRAKFKVKSLLIYSLLAIFLLGIIYEIVYFVR